MTTDTNDSLFLGDRVTNERTGRVYVVINICNGTVWMQREKQLLDNISGPYVAFNPNKHKRQL